MATAPRTRRQPAQPRLVVKSVQSLPKPREPKRPPFMRFVYWLARHLQRTINRRTRLNMSVRAVALLLLWTFGVVVLTTWVNVYGGGR